MNYFKKAKLIAIRVQQSQRVEAKDKITRASVSHSLELRFLNQQASHNLMASVTHFSDQVKITAWFPTQHITWQNNWWIQDSVEVKKTQYTKQTDHRHKTSLIFVDCTVCQDSLSGRVLEARCSCLSSSHVCWPNCHTHVDKLDAAAVALHND
jgi:uncharacterized CHY-type Zn-finger protein